MKSKFSSAMDTKQAGGLSTHDNATGMKSISRHVLRAYVSTTILVNEEGEARFAVLCCLYAQRERDCFALPARFCLSYCLTRVCESSGTFYRYHYMDSESELNSRSIESECIDK
jgi:hypothetical protein